jgi:peptidoglycan/LPS O-acetylase OafA/YrhL
VTAAEEIDPGKAWRQRRGIPIVPVFDSYRAIAILGVAMFHIFQASGVFYRLGDSPAGALPFALLSHTLDVLFIVSGFVVYLPTVVRRGEFGSVRNFAIRRGARLIPAYWLCLGVSLLLIAAFGTSGELPSVTEIALHVSVLQTPALLFDSHLSLGFGVVPPVWTLSVEVGFYIVLPLVAASYFRRPFVGLAAAGALVVGWHYLGRDADAVASFFGFDLSAAANSRFESFYASQFPAWAFSLACGMTGAWIYVRLLDRGMSPKQERQALAVTVVAAVLLVLVAYVAGREALDDPERFLGLFARQSPAISLLYPAVLSVVLIGLAASPAAARKPFEGRFLRWTGDISYAIYLIHFAFIWLAAKELGLLTDGSPQALLIWCVVIYPASYAYAYLSARFVERPVRRWAHQFGRTAQAGTPPKLDAGVPSQ